MLPFMEDKDEAIAQEAANAVYNTLITASDEVLRDFHAIKRTFYARYVISFLKRGHCSETSVLLGLSAVKRLLGLD